MRSWTGSAWLMDFRYAASSSGDGLRLMTSDSSDIKSKLSGGMASCSGLCSSDINGGSNRSYLSTWGTEKPRSVFVRNIPLFRESVELSPVLQPSGNVRFNVGDAGAEEMALSPTVSTYNDPEWPILAIALRFDAELFSRIRALTPLYADLPPAFTLLTACLTAGLTFVLTALTMAPLSFFTEEPKAAAWLFILYPGWALWASFWEKKTISFSNSSLPPLALV